MVVRPLTSANESVGGRRRSSPWALATKCKRLDPDSVLAIDGFHHILIARSSSPSFYDFQICGHKIVHVLLTCCVILARQSKKMEMKARR
jgi:hypothetical protein